MEQPAWIEQIIAFLGQIVNQYGSLGIAAAMFAESAGVPFASAVIFITSGGMILSGKISFWSILLASTAGITLGSVCGYSIGFISIKAGRVLKNTFLSRFFARPVRPHRQSRIYSFWEKYGSFSVFMGQFWGVTRTFISFPAGAMHMNILLFIIYTTLGGALFSLFAIGLSMLLTGFMGLLLKYLKLLLALPPWFWAGLGLLLLTAIIFYRRLGWKASFASLRRRIIFWFARK
ncbi:MAG: VTT domain-containing protein [Bacillota bacterium]